VAEALGETDRGGALEMLAVAASQGVVNWQWVRYFAKALAPRAILQWIRDLRHSRSSESEEVAGDDQPGATV
jgi:hypothetical protein